jgi:SAF domain
VTTMVAPRPPVLSTGNGARSPSPAAHTGRRNRTRIALGVVVIVLCVLATASLFSNANKRNAVLVVRRQIPAGRSITADDLSVARVSVEAGVQTIPSSDRAHLVGRVAAVTLMPGSLLTPEEVSNDARVPDGMAVVGASLKVGQYPASLTTSDNVHLLEVAPPAAMGDAAVPIDRGRATVIDAAVRKDTSDSLAASLLVPAAAADDVANASAAGRLVVVVVAA